MRALVDTNVLLRLVNVSDQQHFTAAHFIDEVKRRGDVPTVGPQVIQEIWAVTTKSRAANGLGLSSDDALALTNEIAARFDLLHDRRTVIAEFPQLMSQHQVRGTNSYDGRRVAAMRPHGIPNLLTL